MYHYSVAVDAEAFYQKTVLLPATAGRNSEYERGQHPITAAILATQGPALAAVLGGDWSTAVAKIESGYGCSYQRNRDGGYTVELIARLIVNRHGIVQADDEKAALERAAETMTTDWPARCDGWELSRRGELHISDPELVEGYAVAAYGR